jgi:hypothetical protein
MVTNFGTTDPSAGDHWYDAGSVVSISATAPSVVDGEQYVWLGWVGSGTISYTGLDNLASVTMNSPITETGAWRHEYRLTMVTNYGTTSPPVGDNWYEVGTPVSIQAFAPSVGAGEQYVWNGWTGTGTISYTGTANPSSVTMNSPISETASWTHQFLLTIKTSGLPSAYPTKVYLAGSQVGMASDSASYTQWFDAGTWTGTIGVDNTVSGAAGTHYVFVKWVEDSSTSNPRASENMNSPKTFTAEYKTQYLVSFTQTGSAIAPNVTYTADTDPTQTVPFGVWVKAGSQITYTYQDIVLGSGVRYVLTSVTPASPQTVNGPLTISGSYKTQYQITVTASPSGAIGGTFKVTYTQCGTTYTNVPKTTSWIEWADSGTSVAVSEPQDTIDISLGSRYKFDHYTPSASVTMNQSKTITIVYKTQYQVSFTQTGSAVAPSVTYTADTDPSGTVPFSVWVKAGSSITYTYQSIVSGGTGVRYVFTSATPASPQTVNGPLTINGVYKTQYLLTVLTDPGGLSPQPTRDPAGEAGPANSWWYDSPTGVTLTAQTVAGYTFSQWDVDGSPKGSGVNPITVSINAPKTATAHYTQITTYALTIVVTQGGTTNPSPGTSTYAPGTQVPVTATPSSGYTFDHWELNGVNVGSADPYTVTMNKDYTLRAVFAQTSRPVGGYSISLIKQTPTSAITVYAMLIVLFGAVLTFTKRKRK